MSRFLAVYLILVTGCTGGGSPPGPGQESVDLQRDKTVTSLKAKLVAGMRDYMEGSDTQYDEGDIKRCLEILDAHLVAVAKAADAREGLNCVRHTVTRLNALNKTCDGELIETDQRELICAIIIRAGALRGFNAEDEDVTEAWREW